MTKFIIVCGLPGSGKTTLACELSKKLKVVCIHKDSIKERLYESLKLSTLEDSKMIGKPSVDIVLYLAEEQLKNGIEVMIEAPFNFPEDYSFFIKLKEKYNLDLISIICSIGKEERIKRFSERERHNSHHDNERIADYENGFDYAEMPGRQMRIITNKPVDILVEEIVAQLI